VSAPWLGRAALLVTVVAAGPRANADEREGRYVEIFATAAGAKRRSLARVDLDALPQRVTQGKDPQYDAELRMRGLPLQEVLASVPIPASADLALLRFDNGLQIPISFRDAAFMKRLAPFVARATTTDRWVSLVPGQIEAPRRPPTEDDLRALRFHGNKVVVSDPTLAPVLPSAAKDLRPWMHADSLSSIELVEQSAWEAQFDAGPATAEGRRVYLGTCRYCHGVRGSGGAYGWDFVEPYPIYSDDWMRRLKRGAGELNPMPGKTMLSIHVRHRAGVDGSRTMPALRGMRTQEVTALWAWLQAVAARSAPAR